MGKVTPHEPFSILFWNVWVDSQLDPEQSAKLHDRFDQIIKAHRPNAIGLNEVIITPNGHSPLLNHLKKYGYQTHFVPFSPEKDGHMGGSAFASLQKPLTLDEEELGPDTSASWRGHPGHTIKLIRVTLVHNGRPVNIIVNYLAHLVPYNWATHLQHHRTFMALTRSPKLRRTTIIGGDFNQFKFMPWLWDAEEDYHRATGTLFNPTWRWKGKVPVIQANYDNIFWTKCGTLDLEDFQVLDRDPSDHTPLLAQFRVKKTVKRTGR